MQAQRYEFSILGGAVRTQTDRLGSLDEVRPAEDDSSLKGQGTGAGIRATWNTRGYYGHEFTLIRSRGTLESKIDEERRSGRTNITMGAYNFLLYMMPAGERWRPYITGGAQMNAFTNPKFVGWPTRDGRRYGFNYGAGIKFFPAKNLFVRLDVRDSFTGKPFDLRFFEPLDKGGRLRAFEGSLGLGIAF